jgi:nitroreductase family protein
MDLATVDKLLTTTRTVRKRLDLTRPVAPAIIQTCLEIAIQAPTGGNIPRYHFVVLTEEAKRTDLAALYKRAYFEVYSPQRQAEVSQSDLRLIASATYLGEHMHEVPVLIIPCVEAPPVQGTGPRSLCQYSTCHVVADAGTPCPWSGVRMDDPASALRTGSSGASGHPRWHSSSSLAPCGVLYRGGLQTRETCTCP